MEDSHKNETDKKGEVTFYQNPRIDHLFGFLNAVTPTKQDAYKPIIVEAVGDDDNQVLLDAYLKKPDKQSVKDFQAEIKKIAGSSFDKDGLIKNPNLVEVVLAFSITEKRFKEVDLDNLAKTVLDGLVGVAFEDDSQVSSLICLKEIHPNKVNGLLIGITKITEERGGFGRSITLFGQEKWD